MPIGRDNGGISLSTSFYTQEELLEIGFTSVGNDVLISRKTSIYGAEHISIGNHVRIDDFAILSGNITIGSYVHIAAATLLFGGNAGIVIQDFATLSSRTAIYAVSDDYSGEYMTNPMTPEKYKNIIEEKVIIGKHVIIATGCTILPGVSLGEGCAVGAMSLIKKDVEPWSMVAGTPARYIKQRSRKLLELEHQFVQKSQKL